jgi:hypothetical protein
MQALKRFVILSYEGNIHKFYIYRVLSNFMLFMPVWVVYAEKARIPRRLWR